LKVLVVASGWPTPERPETSIFVAQEVAFLRARGVDVDVVTYNGERNPANYLRARRDVRRALASQRFDLVHGHFGQTGLVLWGIEEPYVITFHGSDLLGVIGQRERNTPRGLLLRAISRRTARRAARVIVAGDRLVGELPPEIPYVLIPAGVDPVLFSPGAKDDARRELGLGIDRKLVLFSGSPDVARKRFGLAKEAVRLLGDPLVDLVTVGGVTRDVVAKYMRACDALLVTAVHESGPLTVKEALASNLPVVAVDVGDIRGRISDLPGCVLCADDSARTIADGLRTVLSSQGPFEGRSAVEDVLQDRLADRLVALYEDVVATAGRS
jgi:teichuronic acid biosynthesis glycosyltransferase TuaC